MKYKSTDPAALANENDGIIYFVDPPDYTPSGASVTQCNRPPNLPPPPGTPASCPTAVFHLKPRITYRAFGAVVSGICDPTLLCTWNHNTSGGFFPFNVQIDHRIVTGKFCWGVTFTNIITSQVESTVRFTGKSPIGSYTATATCTEIIVTPSEP